MEYLLTVFRIIRYKVRLYGEDIYVSDICISKPTLQPCAECMKL